MSNLGNLDHVQGRGNLNHYRPICWAPLDDLERSSSMWLIWQTLLTTHSLSYIFFIVSIRYLYFPSRQGIKVGDKMVWIRACICGRAETCLQDSWDAWWALTLALFLIVLQNTGKIKIQKRNGLHIVEAEMADYRKEWLKKQNKTKSSTEGSALTSITAVPSPASVADAFPRVLVTNSVVATTVLLTALSVPTLWNEMGRLSGCLAGGAPGRPHFCLWNMLR